MGGTGQEERKFRASHPSTANLNIMVVMRGSLWQFYAQFLKPTGENMNSEIGKCPVLGGAHRHTSVGTTSNQHWWPNQLNLTTLQQNSPLSDPMGTDFNYAEEFKTLDL